MKNKDMTAWLIFLVFLTLTSSICIHKTPELSDVWPHLFAARVNRKTALAEYSTRPNRYYYRCNACHKKTHIKELKNFQNNMFYFLKNASQTKRSDSQWNKRKWYPFGNKSRFQSVTISPVSLWFYSHSAVKKCLLLSWFFSTFFGLVITFRCFEKSNK